MIHRDFVILKKKIENKNKVEVPKSVITLKTLGPFDIVKFQNSLRRIRYYLLH